MAEPHPVAEDPADFEVLCGLAQCHLETDEPEQALRAARAAAEVRPESAYPFRLMSAALIDLGDPKAAVDAANAAVERDPRSWQGHAALAVALAMEQQRRGAQAAAQRTVQLAPTEPHALATLGQVYRALGKPRQARAAYRQALRLAPLDPQIASELAAIESGLVAPIHAYAVVAALNPGVRELAYRTEAAAWFLLWLANLLGAAVIWGAVYLIGTNGRAPAPAGVRIAAVLGTWLVIGAIVQVVRRRLDGPGREWLRMFFRRPSVRVVLAGYAVGVLSLAWLPMAHSYKDSWPVLYPIVASFLLSSVVMLRAAVPWLR